MVLADTQNYDVKYVCKSWHCYPLESLPKKWTHLDTFTAHARHACRFTFVRVCVHSSVLVSTFPFVRLRPRPCVCAPVRASVSPSVRLRSRSCKYVHFLESAGERETVFTVDGVSTLTEISESDCGL